MQTPAFEQAIQYAFERLRAELAPARFYHDLYHTKDDVLPAATRLARLSGISDSSLRLLRIGAAYHDIGYIKQDEGHELISIEICAEILPGFGFSPAQIRIINGLIMATRIPQSPQSFLEQVISDADLDGLGRKDFLERSHRLQRERARYGMPTTRLGWYQRQLEFLQNHAYFTPAAKSLRNKQKQENIAQLKQLLKSRAKLALTP